MVVAETLNFTKSTEKLYIAQPALSRQIQLLEREIGATLFDRSKKKVQLTAAGKYFKEEARRIIAQLDLAKRKAQKIQEGKAGEILLGHASSAMQSIIPSLLKKVKTTLPDLKIGLEEGTNRLIFQKLLNREMDFGLVPNAVIPGEMESIVAYRENFVLITPENYKISKKTFTTLKEFRNDNWILPPKNEGYGYVELLDRIFQRHGFLPKVVYESPNSSSVLRLVSAGLGITLISKSSLNNLNLNIKYIEMDQLTEKVEMRLVWLKERDTELSQYRTVMMEFLK